MVAKKENKSPKRIAGGVLPGPKPEWLRKSPIHSAIGKQVDQLLASNALHTVCQEAQCPNIGECFAKQTATFLLLGDICTRNCKYCAVRKGQPKALDPFEPQKIANLTKALQLKHVVLTSVTRDDLPDGGASVFVETIHSIRQISSTITIEVLIPDYQNEALHAIFKAKPTILNHNIEATKNIFSRVRPKGNYEKSLQILKQTEQHGLTTKSGFMVGMGESKQDIFDTLKDLRKHGCSIVTIGQYLPPSAKHYPTKQYITPQEFDSFAEFGHSLGIPYVFSGPLVRSSYMAKEVLSALVNPELS